MSTFDREKLNKDQREERKVKKHTIMVVDDDKGQLNSMVSLLSNDCNVIAARDGQEALDIIKKMKRPKDISLIISDQRMPKLTGIRLFEKLIPIMPGTFRIILINHDDKGMIIDALNKAQIYKFILKPFDPDDLKLTVKRAIEAFESQRELNEYRLTLGEVDKKNLELSLTDPLTGLRNRRYLYETIDRDIAKVDRDYEIWKREQGKNKRPTSALAFLLLALDNFKWINDLLDHLAGDKVLVQAANILRRECREGSILVRWGSDEFMVVSHFPKREQVSKLAARLLHAIKEELYDPRKVKDPPLGCSIGFALYPFLPGHPGEPGWEQVITIVDRALFAAKDTGGNAWVGISGTEKTKPGNLYERIQKDIKKLLAGGDLEVVTSIPNESDLVWEKK